MKNKLVIILCLIVVVAFTGCSNEKAMDNTEELKEAVKEAESNTVIEKDNKEVKSETNSQGSGLVKCGEVYKDKELSYNIIGVRTKEYSDGVKNLILKLEVFNHSSSNLNFTAMDRLTVYNGENIECMLNILAGVESDLTGTITPDNKIMGEVAFEITDNESDYYTLHVGEMFEYSPAIEMSSDDIDKTFAEQFEGSGVKSEYTIGVPVESEQLTILLNSATVNPSDKEGKEIILLDLALTNNDSDPVNFMGGINLGGVFTADGIQLDEAVNHWTLPNNSIDGGKTMTGIISYDIEEGTRDFYMTVTPNLDEFSNKVNIVFTAK